MRKKLKYGVVKMADGGPVSLRGSSAADAALKKKGRKKPKMKPPEKGGTPKEIVAKGPPGGSGTPGAKGTYKRKMADGGKVVKKGDKKKKLPPESLGSGFAQRAGSAIKGRQSALDKKLKDAGA